MSVEDDDIVKAKESLQNALGERFTDYMQSMRKWFSGKSTKQEFDREAREIVTDNYVHLHNEFLLCIITKCNNFSSTVSEAATKPIHPSSIQSRAILQKPRKKLKTGESNLSATKPMSYHLRFVPVDSIKHAPSIITASIEAAALSNKDFALEFCARERSLPYYKMIHGRLLLGAIDFNLQHVDIKAVFLLAEATIWMLKNVIAKLASRSEFKHQLRCESSYENYKRIHITDSKILESHKKRFDLNNVDQQFELDSNFLNKLKTNELNDAELNATQFSQTDFSNEEDENEKDELNNLSNYLTNPAIVPKNKLSTNLFDLKNVFECHRSLMPSHSIYTINMERIICNLWHQNDAD